jgi:hypothetical protein
MLELPAAPLSPELAPPPHAVSMSIQHINANAGVNLTESLTISMPFLNAQSVIQEVFESRQ